MSGPIPSDAELTKLSVAVNQAARALEAATQIRFPIGSHVRVSLGPFVEPHCGTVTAHVLGQMRVNRADNGKKEFWHWNYLHLVTPAASQQGDGTPK